MEAGIETATSKESPPIERSGLGGETYSEVEQDGPSSAKARGPEASRPSKEDERRSADSALGLEVEFRLKVYWSPKGIRKPSVETISRVKEALERVVS